MMEQEIQASMIVGRLEEAVEKATEAIKAFEQGDESDKSFNDADLGLKGESWQNVQGFLQARGRWVQTVTRKTKFHFFEQR